MTGTVTTQAEAQVRELMEHRAGAMRARDAEALVAQYAAQTVTFDLAPPLQKVGPEAQDTAGLTAWFAGFDGEIGYEVRDLIVAAGDDLAYCHSLNALTVTPHGASDSFTLWLRATVCLRKVEGSWSITHEHNSTPFYMDGSLKAAVDLQP